MYVKVKKCLIGVLSVVSIVPISYVTKDLSVYADNVSAGGNNTTFNIAGVATENISNTGVMFRTHDDYGYNLGGSYVVGAKVTAYKTSDESIIQGAKGKTGSDLTNYLHNNLRDFHIVRLNNDYRRSYSAYVYKDSCSGLATYDCSFVLNPTSLTSNAPLWIKKKGGTNELRGNYLSALSDMSVSGLNDTLYNSEIMTVCAEEISFVASNSEGSYSETGTNTLPEGTCSSIKEATQSLINSNVVSSSDMVIWLVEPLISVDVELESGKWFPSGVAVTPSMMAYADSIGIEESGLSHNRFKSIVDFVSTNLLSGNRNISGNGTLIDDVNVKSFGAYSLIVSSDTLTSRDELPEIPSVPVFIKDSKSGSTIHYSDISSTIPQNVWKDITDVLSYAMHLTEVEPSNGLYSWCSTEVNEMRKYSNNAKNSEGVYSSDYSSAYENLWNAICGYYNNIEISLEGTSTSVPVRMSNTQPSSVDTKFGGGNGPFVVEGGSLGGISSVNYTMNYSENGAQFYALGDQLDIVSTGTTDVGDLGSSTGSKTLSVGDILRNPYRYSIVVEDVDAITAVNGDPQPPNIIVYDEKGGSTWEASIDKNSWNSVLNTMHYMRGEGESNVLGIVEADTARNARNWTSYGGEACSFTSNYNAWVTEKKKLEEKKQALVDLKTYLTNTNTTIDEYYTLFESANLSYTHYTDSPHIYDLNSSTIQHVPDGSNPNPLQRQVSNEIKYGVLNPDKSSSSCSYMTLGLDSEYKYWDTYKTYMNDHYYTDEHTYGIYCFDYSRHSTYAPNNYFFTVNYNIDSSGNGTPKYEMPGWNDVYGIDHSGDSWDWAIQSCSSELMASWYIESAKGAYMEILNKIPNDISNLDTQITKFQTLIDDYNSHLNTYDTNYNLALSKIATSFGEKKLVDGTRNDSAVENDITDNLCKRTGESAIGTMSHLYKYQTYKANESGQMYAAWIASDNYYSAYDDYDGTISRTLGPIGSSLYSEISRVYNSQEYPLNFRYRVVSTGSAGTAMTTTSIKDYVNKPCGYQLSYEDVIKAPYSYGIIINCYETVKRDPTIEEWQTSIKTTKNGIDDSSVWNWTGVTPSIEFETPCDDLVLSTPETGEGSVTWFTGKITGRNNGGTADTPPTIADGSSLGLSEGNPSWGSGVGKKRALYQITKNWGGESGTGTITILTTDITSKVLTPCSNTYVNVSGESSFSYDVNSGSTFNIWKNNGVFNLDARFPMMRASSAVNGNDSYNPKPNNIVNDGYGGTYATPKSFGIGDGGYYPIMCRIPGSSERSIETQYNVKFSYGGTAKISTTFSTDENDTSDMQSIIDGMSGGMVIPYVKAGQNIDGELNNNELVIEGWCNVGSGTDVKTNGTNATFDTIDDFKNAMNNLVNDVKSNAKYEVLSTINGFNVDYNNNAVTDAESYQIKHNQANGKVDQQAGLKFETSGSEANSSTVTDEESGVYVNRYARLNGQDYSEDDHGPIGNAGVLGSKTQEAYNRLMVVGEGDGEWYYEYSEGLTEVYYRAVIHIPVSEFHATISRYESDSNTSADAYVKEQKDDLLNAWKRFGYETELGTFNGEYCNVIVPSIDLSGLSDESKELLYNDASGSVVSKILGRQTPIHIRGSVYDNT